MMAGDTHCSAVTAVLANARSLPPPWLRACLAFLTATTCRRSGGDGFKFSQLLLLLLLAIAPPIARPQETTTAPAEQLLPFTHTPQIGNPLRPLAHLPVDAHITINAVVASVPDPSETRLGRSFDIVVAAMLNGFQAHGYVLDGFALHWPIQPNATGKDEKSGGASAQQQWQVHQLQQHQQQQSRSKPGVLLFRRDDKWRKSGGPQDSEYYLVFLVGESPTYGVQPEAFRRAARCAVHFNGGGEVVWELAPNQDCDITALPAESPRLDVMGPAFSGSAQSLAVGLARLCAPEECLTAKGQLNALLLSPSATVGSNARIAHHPFLMHPRAGPLGPTTRLAGTLEGRVATTQDRVAVEYFPLAVHLNKQFERLVPYLCQLSDEALLQNRDNRPFTVAVLAEESTFGRDMLQIVRGAPTCKKEDIRFVTAQFPPNIASIRVEQARLRKPQLEQQRSLRPATSRLLEFNLDEADAGRDRPPVYQPLLSSRSDELMLYRTFDSMRTYSRPDVVVVVATDIRDRLFLLGRIRDEMPAALPVLMELDYLTIHPDYRKISRGAVVVPGADSVVCLDNSDTLVACYGKSRETRYFSFPSDYAANVFRAVSLLIEYARAGRATAAFSAFAEPRMRTVNKPAPRLLVATLAGFQSLTDNQGTTDKARSYLAAAELRALAQVPTYLALILLAGFYLVVATWLWADPNEGRTVLPLARHLIFDSGWLMRRLEAIPQRMRRSVGRLRGKPVSGMPAPRIKRAPEPGVESMTPRHNRTWLLTLIALSAGTAVVAGWRLQQLITRAECMNVECGKFLLAHGRDIAAPACIWLLYGCVAVVGHLRLDIVDRRYSVFLNALEPASRRGRRYPWTNPRASWVTPILAGLMVLVVYRRVSSTPISVDPAYPWLFAIAILGIGIGFLIQLGRQLRMLDRLTLFLSACIPHVRELLEDNNWPQPHSINELPQTPFNLSLHRYRDLRMLRHRRPEQWGYLTCCLIDGGDNVAPLRSPKVFDEWQAQLVAEMKLVVIAIRTCAWCAMLAPIAVLLATAAFTPVYVGALSSASIALLVVGFAMTVYVVLRLETDPMLGVMFTRDGDTLTFGGGLRALWPKFVAMGLVLLPLVAPEVWGWLHGLMRSTNSIG